MKGHHGKFVCENFNFVSWREKNKKRKQLPKGPKAHVYGWVHTWQRHSDYMPSKLKVTKSPNRCFLSFLSWPLLRTYLTSGCQL